MEGAGELVVRARRGDAHAGRALFDRFQPAVLGYCRLSANGDRDRARELCQETFARAFERLEQLSEPDRFEGWLFTIAQNLCRSESGRASRKEEACDVAALSEAVLLPDVEDALDRARLGAALKTAMAKVDDGVAREVARLHYEEATPTREIAVRLGLPHGTVTVKLMRLRAELRRRLCRLLAEETPA